MDYEAARIIGAIERHINRRSGINPADYGRELESLRVDRRDVANDGKDCRAMLRLLRRFSSLQAETMREALKAYGGRLSYDDATQSCDYAPGQYWATEYRAAAGAVLARAITLHLRQGTAASPHDDRMRAERELGRGIARRWF